jgi:hypothetical protein
MVGATTKEISRISGMPVHLGRTAELAHNARFMQGIGKVQAAGFKMERGRDIGKQFADMASTDALKHGFPVIFCMG